MPVEVKICGLRNAETMRAAIDHGASHVGLVFFEASPRFVTPQQAGDLVKLVPPHVKAVGVFVDPESAYLEHVLSEVPLDMVQLHGNETPDRIQDIKHNYNLPIIKALPLAEKKDLLQVKPYRTAADMLLFDAKPPKNVVATLPGGMGIAFDWDILSDISINIPWFLSGGLHTDNLQEAIQTTHTKAVDVSSGVEDSPGNKSIEKIEAFLKLSAQN